MDDSCLIIGVWIGSMTMETIQRTMIRQESSMFQESSMSSSRASGGRPIPIQSSASDASEVRCHGPGLERPVLGKQNSFTVDWMGIGRPPEALELDIEDSWNMEDSCLIIVLWIVSMVMEPIQTPMIRQESSM